MQNMSNISQFFFTNVVYKICCVQNRLKNFWYPDGILNSFSNFFPNLQIFRVMKIIFCSYHRAEQKTKSQLSKSPNSTTSIAITGSIFLFKCPKEVIVTLLEKDTWNWLFFASWVRQKINLFIIIFKTSEVSIFI